MREQGTGNGKRVIVCEVWVDREQGTCIPRKQERLYNCGDRQKLHLSTTLTMPTTEDFLQLTQWLGIGTLVSIAFTLLCFAFKWGFRFRFVGVSSFMGVLTASVFALSLVPFSPTVVPGAVRYSVVFDNGATHTAIAVSPEITASELEATLKQAAMNLASYGRSGARNARLTVLARTIVHPQPNVSEPVYLGKAEQSLYQRDDEEISIEIDAEKLNQLQALQSS